MSWWASHFASCLAQPLPRIIPSQYGYVWVILWTKSSPCIQTHTTMAQNMCCKTISSSSRSVLVTTATLLGAKQPGKPHTIKENRPQFKRNVLVSGIHLKLWAFSCTNPVELKVCYCCQITRQIRYVHVGLCAYLLTVSVKILSKLTGTSLQIHEDIIYICNVMSCTAMLCYVIAM